jgi:hypothetical protein
VSHKIKPTKKPKHVHRASRISASPTTVDMTNYLTQLYGKPCVLREETDNILCPTYGYTIIEYEEVDGVNRIAS